MTRLRFLGPHTGYVRQLARGTRLVCRDYVPRWQMDYLEPGDALHALPPLLPTWRGEIDAVTWVPGHDGSLGPGFYVAEVLACSLRVPMVEALTRSTKLDSAHASIERPAFNAVRQSLSADPDIVSPQDRILVVDNVIASGATMRGALAVLRGIGCQHLEAFSISVDPLAGSSAYLSGLRQCNWPSRQDVKQARIAA